MVDIQKLKGIIVSNGLTQADVADLLGISSNTFYRKMQKGVFDTDEVKIMMDNLKIDNPIDIFFSENVAYNATKSNDTK